MFTVSSVEEYIDGTPAAAGIFIKETRDQAVSEFHYKMWAGMNAANIKTIVVTVQDELGNVLQGERWVREGQVVEDGTE